MAKNVINALSFSNELESLVCNFLYEIAVFIDNNGEQVSKNLVKVNFQDELNVMEGKIAYVFYNKGEREVYVYLQKPNRKLYKDIELGNLSAESILKVAEKINKVMNP